MNPVPKESSGVPTAREVTSELQRILAMPEFLASERLTQFLKFVVTESLAGREGRIKAYTVGVEAFGRRSSFSPRADSIVGVTAQRLRRALDRYYARHRDAPVRITIPQGAYRPLFRRTVRPGRSPERRQLEPSIAVLPFSHLGRGDADVFAEGLAEELSNALCRFDGIRVVPHVSALHLKNDSYDVTQVGAELGVSFLLTGTVQVLDTTLCVRVALIRAQDRTQVWSERFDEGLDVKSLFQLQDTIVAGVSRSIAGECGVVLRAVYADLQSRAGCDGSTYEAVMRSHQYEHTISIETFRAAREALERALEASPANALAWAHYGIVCLDSAAFGFGEIEEPISRGSEAIRRALELHPRCQFAHYGKAFACLLRKDRDGVRESAERIVELNPNNVFLVGAAGFFVVLAGDHEYGLPLLRLSMKETPHYPTWWRFPTFLDALRRGAVDELSQEAERFEMPDFFWGPLLRATANAYAGRSQEADESYVEVLRLQPDFAERPDYYVGQFVLDHDAAKLILEPACGHPRIASDAGR